GLSWNSLSSVPSGFGSGNGISFVDSRTGWVIGSDVLKTTDAGETWISQGPNVNTTRALVALSFTDRNNGTLVGEQGGIFRTTDGGQTWVNQSQPVSNFLRSVSMVDSSIGWALGGSGIILHTGDAGDTWE